MKHWTWIRYVLGGLLGTALGAGAGYLGSCAGGG
jgi:hypothetical protein